MIKKFLSLFFFLPAFLYSAQPGAETTIKQKSTSPNTPATLIIPIDTQLRDFRDNAIEAAYYDTTSKDFRNATPFDEFKEFVAHYPILTTHQAIEVKPNSIQEGEANITVILDPDKDAVPVTYLLVQEGNKWKIWNLSVTPLYSEKVMNLLKNPRTMEVPIDNQLRDLERDNILKAYEIYTSTQFKKTTSLQAFRSFLKDFPFFTRHVGVRYRDPIVQKGTGIIEVLIDTETSTAVVDYILGIEDDLWKIWSIQVEKQAARETPLVPQEYQPSQNMNPPLQNIPEEFHPSETHSNIRISQSRQPENNEAPGGPMDFSRIEIGSKTNLSGRIINPSTSLRSNQGDIFVNLYVHNGVFGTKIIVSIEHLESHTSIPSIATTLEQDGNIEVSFVFSPPPSGWPKGHYILTAEASMGAKRSIDFTVN